MAGALQPKLQNTLTFLLAPPRDTLGLVLKSPSKLNMISLFPLRNDLNISSAKEFNTIHVVTLVYSTL